MTKINLLFGAAIALAAGMLAGCSKEPAAENQIQTVDRDQVRYLNVTIVNPSAIGTRAAATDFINGTTAENFVKNMTFVFYDAQGLPTGQAVDKSFTTNNASDGFTNNANPNNVEKIWSETIEVNLAQGENLPAQVVAFINTTATADVKKASLADLNTTLRQRVRTETDNNFLMSNSVYYGDNPVTGETNVRVFATPISTDQLFTSEAQAKDDKNKNNTVDIYVERYAARVTLDIEKDNIADYEGVNGYKLTFVPEAWRVNATDLEMYMVKRFGLIGADEKVNYDPTLTALNAQLNWEWNDPDNFRSYWATSPSYYLNSYPTVSDDITDVAADNDYKGTGATAYPYAEHYFNYSQFISGSVDGTDAKFSPAITWDETKGFDSTPFYARETTTASRAWTRTGTGYNPLATMPSAVIVGHYKLTSTTEGADAIADKTTFYLYGKTGNKHNLYFEAGIKAAMIANQNVVLTRTGNDTDGYTYTVYDGTAGFVVEHPSAAVRKVKVNNETKVAGRLVALQLDGTQPNLYYYNTTEKAYQLIDDTNINLVNSDLLTAGYATRYGNGLAYFNIPIEHLGGAVKKADGKTYDFANCPAGSFGVVRNHAYTIKVTGITGLATALRDDTQPIVPPVDAVSYYINAKLNILSWRIVNEQEVTL